MEQRRAVHLIASRKQREGGKERSESQEGEGSEVGRGSRGELGGMEGGEIVVGMYCVRVQSIFN